MLRFEAWLVADVGVEFEVSDEFAGGLVHDPDVEVIDDENNLRSFERAAEADVVHFFPARRSDTVPVLSMRSWRIR